MVKKYLSFQEFAQTDQLVLARTLYYTVRVERDVRFKYYIMDRGVPHELVLFTENTRIKAYGPAPESQPRYPGDKYSFTASFGKLTPRPVPPGPSDITGDVATHADVAAVHIMQSIMYLTKTVAYDAMVFAGYVGEEVIFGQNTPYAFTVSRCDPKFEHQINHPSNYEKFKAFFPKTIPGTRPIKIAELKKVYDTWLEKFNPELIMQIYASKPHLAGPPVADAYLTLYLPQIDYRSDKNLNAESTMVMIKESDYDSVIAKSCSQNIIEKPTPFTIESTKFVEVRAWQILDSSPDKMALNAMANIYSTPEIYIGKQTTVFRLPVLHIMFHKWIEFDGAKDRPPPCE